MVPVHDVLSVLLGSLVGFSLGLIGGGGSILTVPLLVYVIGEPVSAAISTSLAIVGSNALAGFVAHWRQHQVRLRIGVVFGLAGTVGAFAGTWLGHILPGREILFLFALFMLAAALTMLLRNDRSASAEKHGAFEEPRTVRGWSRILATGVGVGVLTGFFGVGGGFVVVPALVILLGMPMRLAVGTSLLIIVINSAAGLAAHLQYGGVSVPTAVLFVLGGLMGTAAGARLAGRVHESRLRQIFAYGLVAVALYLVLKNHPSGPQHTSALFPAFAGFQ